MTHGFASNETVLCKATILNMYFDSQYTVPNWIVNNLKVLEIRPLRCSKCDLYRTSKVLMI